MNEQTINAVKMIVDESPSRNFMESVDMAINLKNLDMSQPRFRVNEEIILPHGLGRPIAIAVFARGETALQAKDAAADIIIDPDEIEEYGGDKNRARELANSYDFFIAEAAYMPSIGRYLGPILGPRGKMPEPLTPDKDIAHIINKTRSSIKLRSKDRKTFHAPVGRRDMPVDDLAENIEAVVTRLEQVLDKGVYNIKSIYVTTTMGKSAKVR
ncbi:MAG: 50S ribosomal protein L1 [Nitrospiraceae bacterium]|nr:50S ribosomal protein L1 [Nitrospiraceae bacterium]